MFRHLKMLLKSKSVLEQKKYDQKELNIQIILDLNLNKQYTDADFNDSVILKRTLILLCQVRFEMKTTHIRIISHINYDAISQKVISAIDKQMIIDEKVYRNLFSDTIQ